MHVHTCTVVYRPTLYRSTDLFRTLLKGPFHQMSKTIMMATVMMMVVMISMMMVVNLQIEGLYPKHKRTNRDDGNIEHKVFLRASRRWRCLS